MLQSGLKEPWRSPRAAPAQSRINTGVGPGCSGLCSVGSWNLHGWRILHASASLLFFILWVKNVFLVPKLNHPCFTISHPPALQHCEEPGSAGSVLPLTPPPPVIPMAEERAVIATGCASVGTAQRVVGLPHYLTFNLLKKHQQTVTDISVPQTASSLCLLYRGKFILGSQGYYWNLWHTKTRFLQAKGMEITHVKFPT